jgi:pyruvate/2-oxoglutarate dehydrogenase complex dihydrolipoamide acyltransferase (E2) component
LKIALKLPLFGMNMEEGTIAKWHRQPGEEFKKGEQLYDVETEKVVSEVEAPCDGRMVEILFAEGDTARVGEVVCQIEVAKLA